MNTIKIEQPWFVYTQQRIDSGFSPFVIWAKTEKMLRYRFTLRYGIKPVKVTPCHWDSEIGKYVENNP
jgi:hypothetical protein